MKILIVDDEKDIVDLLETLIELDFEEASVHKAYNGQQGIDKINQLGQELSLVISDMNMPEKKGIEVFRQNQGLENVPMILMTGANELSAEEQSEFEKSNPLNSIVTKPWDQDKFLNLIKKLAA